MAAPDQRTLDRLKIGFNPQPLVLGFLALAFLALGFLAGCSRPRPPSPGVPEACADLAKTMANQENAFVARVQAIRKQHILLQDYDRQMIAALEERRAALQSTALTGLSVKEDLAGCSGKALADLRLQAREEMMRLQDFLNTFHRALNKDPKGVFIDEP
jgi:hypothetical protein